MPSFLEFLTVGLEVDIVRTKDDRYIWRWRICVVVRENQVYFITPEESLTAASIAYVQVTNNRQIQKTMYM